MPAVAGAVLAAVVVLVLAARCAPSLTSPARRPPPSTWTTGRRGALAAWWGTRRRTRHGPDDTAIADWCGRVAADLRAGSSLTTAIVAADADAGPAATPFPDVAHAIRRGQPLAEALRAAPHDPTTGAGLAAPVLATCAELGGPAAGAVERIVTVLQARDAARQERRAASAQARLSAQVLTAVPIGVVALLVVTEPSIRTTLTTPAGAACLAVGGALDLAGWAWMRRMIGDAS
ncbi:MAG TPA: type II secretion system F family protein [Ilumatobacteraceae bacterium]|nr:type II secretion system F family protein [Ilumatobacteraceae bacterium]